MNPSSGRVIYCPAVVAVPRERTTSTASSSVSLSSSSGKATDVQPPQPSLEELDGELGFAFLVHDPVNGRAWITPRSASQVNAFSRALSRGETLPPAIWKEAKKVLPNSGKMVQIPLLGARTGRALAAAPPPNKSGFARFFGLGDSDDEDQAGSGYASPDDFDDNPHLSHAQALDKRRARSVARMNALRPQVEEFLQACCTSLPEPNGAKSTLGASGGNDSFDWWASENVRQFFGGPVPEDESAFGLEFGKLSQLLSMSRLQHTRKPSDTVNSDEPTDNGHDGFVSPRPLSHSNDNGVASWQTSMPQFSARDLRLCDLGEAVASAANSRWLDVILALPPPPVPVQVSLRVYLDEVSSPLSVGDSPVRPTVWPMPGRREEVPLFRLLEQLVPVLDRLDDFRRSLARSVGRDASELLDLVDTLRSPAGLSAFFEDLTFVISTFGQLCRVLTTKGTRASPETYVYLSATLTHLATVARWGTAAIDNAVNEVSVTLDSFQVPSHFSEADISRVTQSPQVDVPTSLDIGAELERLGIAVATNADPTATRKDLEAVLVQIKKMVQSEPQTSPPSERYQNLVAAQQHAMVLLDRISASTQVASPGLFARLAGTDDLGIETRLSKARSLLENYKSPLEVAELLEESMFTIIGAADASPDSKTVKKLTNAISSVSQCCVQCRSRLDAFTTSTDRRVTESVNPAEVVAAIRRIEDVQENITDFQYSFLGKHGRGLSSSGAVEQARAVHAKVDDDMFAL